MPFLRRVLFHPSVPNRQAVRDALSTSVQEGRAAGLQIGLFGRVFPPKGVELGLVHVFPDLAAFDKFRQTPGPGPARLAALGEQFTCIEMYEVVPPPGGPNPANRYARVTGYRPALGKAAELRQRLEAYVKEREAAGVGMGRWEQVVPDRGPVFRLTVGFADLAAFERFRDESRRDATTMAAVRDLSLLLQEPPNVELWENLTPA